MATYDFGGGCPCGISKVCDCKANYCKHNKQHSCEECDDKYAFMDDLAFNGLAGKNWSKQMPKNDFDFGFSTVEEPKPIEDKTKLYGLRDMIMPLLNNLAKNPEQEMIRWPNRKAKIDEFIKKMNEYIEK